MPIALLGCKEEQPPAPPPGVYIPSVKAGESVFGYLARTRGGFDLPLYRQLIGAANEYKEGDEAAGLAAADGLFTLIEQGVDPARAATLEGWKMSDLVDFLLDQPEEAIEPYMTGLSSDLITCVVKLLSNEELIAVSRKAFNPLPGSKVGARGYLGARIQPNSPTDHPDDIRRNG